MIWIILGLPVLVWALSYMYLVAEFRTWDLRDVKVHETGRYTLTETIFYYNHFLRELPIDALLALAVLWSYSAAGLRLPARLGPDQQAWSAAALAVFLVVVVTGSIRRVGLRATLMDLFQFRERDELISWGSHWQMHFLSTAALMLLLVWPGTLIQTSTPHQSGLLLLLGLFLGLSLAFGTTWKALTHRRWLLHGAREIFTYFLLVAVPMLSPILFDGRLWDHRPGAIGIAVLGVFLLINAYILTVYRQSDLGAEAQSQRGLLFLTSSHFFEHVLDFVFVFLLLALLGN